MDLFSKMDYFYKKNSVISCFVIIFFCRLIWFSLLKNKIFFKTKNFCFLNKKFSRKFFVILQKKRIKKILLVSRLVVILWISFTFINLINIIPYSYGFTTQVLHILFLRISLWFCFFFGGLFYKFFFFVGHFTPQGRPLFLVFPLNYIELLRNIIRPLTLSLRLSIKMTTGHVLITLLATSLTFKFCKNKKLFIILVGCFLFFYLFFEIFVGFIQGFVYCFLKGEYIEENLSPHKKIENEFFCIKN